MTGNYAGAPGPKLTFLVVVFLALLGLQACEPNKPQVARVETPVETDTAIEIVTTAMEFRMTGQVQPGWQTFRYINMSDQPHFFLLEKYPEDKTLADGRREVFPVFQSGMDLIVEGDMEGAGGEFGKLPAWFFDVVFSGGSGMVSPGQTAVTTVKLEPGYYVIECYVKMPNGVFHSAVGMSTALVVAGEPVPEPEFAADVQVEISSTDGMVFSDAIQQGRNTFSVFFKDQVAHENFVGHDVNLARLDESASLEELEKWMSWLDPKGLIAPGPQGVTFLGGVNDMTAGSTGYFTAELIPGRYALVSEVPDTRRKNLLKTFVVSGD